MQGASVWKINKLKKKCWAVAHHHLHFAFKMRQRSWGVFKKCPLPFAFLSSGVVRCMNAHEIFGKSG